MSDTTITRANFNQALGESSVDIEKAKADPRLAGVNVAAADLNQDGVVEGASEVDRLFLEVDKSDRDGSYQSMRTTKRDGTATVVASQLEALGDQTGVIALREPMEQSRQRIRSNNQVLLIGLNKTSSHEATSLRKGGTKVTHVRDARRDDSIAVGGRRFDLTTPEGTRDFASTLGLSPSQTDAIAEVILLAGDDARDEVAQIAKVWAEAEKGQRIPARLVLSGHSVGRGVWGDDNGYLRFNTLQALTEAMPHAARQVRDFHIAGCYSGGQSAMERWRGLFPNVDTIWAYTGSAPGSYSGATTHLGRWDRATRGEGATLDREVAARTRKGENVAVWSRDAGYRDGTPATDIADLRSGLADSRTGVQGFYTGEDKVENTQRGPLREHYNQVQRMLQHPDLRAGAERDSLGAERDATIRLIYFTKTIAPRFAREFASEIEAGYTALGLAVPDFSKASRREALAAIAEFEQALGNSQPSEGAAWELWPVLKGGLRDLQAEVIPETWI